MPEKITKILVANRGEIACRIIRTCQKMGIETVAVCSTADRYARHTALADAFECVGGPAPAESYLNAEAILAAARQHGADAIHPGYGFLAENADFAQACADQGLIFIGAPVAAMRLMASKSAAKETMEAAGVACVPGYHGDNQNPDFLRQQAEKIGWPVLIKASAGGGGKGMKIVPDATHFDEALNAAKSEARKAFGDDRVILEKFITHPRHIEVQVFSDRLGNHRHLFERDCSAQRRYQKIIEEAPAAGLAEDTRQAMLQAAVRAAQAVDYEGAGTVEFILDQNQQFYFLEMNTRLQVEHRVTELITGTDLVAWQILVAEGRPLPVSQDNLAPKGHAIEARIYAEDAGNDFLPSVGLLDRLRFPAEEDGRVVVDTGVRQSDRISIHYDPMIAKLVVWAENRADAIDAMNNALRDTLVSGVKSNLASLATLINHPRFRDNCLYTNAIDQGMLDKNDDGATSLPRFLAAIVDWQLHHKRERAGQRGKPEQATPVPWQSFGPDWQRLLLRQGNECIEAEWRIADETLTLRPVARGTGGVPDEAHASSETGTFPTVRFAWPLPWSFRVHETPEAFHVIVGHQRRVFEKKRHDTGQVSEGNEWQVLAPMPGQVLNILVAPGEAVSKGQTVAVMEAMKMELSLKAPRDACVESVHHAVGDLLQAGDPVLSFVDDKAEQGDKNPSTQRDLT